MLDLNYFKSIISNFQIKGNLISIELYGNGHINTTYLAVVKNNEKEEKYILQKINSTLFKPVENLMSNIEKVTEFIHSKITEQGGDYKKESLSLIYTNDNKSFYRLDENNYFRIYIFLENTIAVQLVENPQDFYNSAIAFGKFDVLLSQFDVSTLYEILPNFHNTVVRYENFIKALEEDVKDRAKLCQDEINFVINRKHYCDKIINLLTNGKMPYRVTHNDTKLNNVLLDKNTRLPVAVIDLDTIMPGSICYDFGDSIRFGCNSSLEDEVDLTKVYFREDLYKVYLDGFLSVYGEAITDIEKENLPFGAILMTYECGMRFLTDYLQGDTYFKIHRENHNLDCARTQFKLVSDMEKYFNIK